MNDEAQARIRGCYARIWDFGIPEPAKILDPGFPEKRARLGGSAIRHLLSKGDCDPASLVARKLAALSSDVQLIKGDFQQSTELFACAGVPIWGVMLIGWPSNNEEQQGKAMIVASAQHGVSRIVDASVERGGDQKSSTTPTMVPHFASKYRVEKHLEATAHVSGGRLTYTIVRPVTFCDSWTDNLQGRTFWKLFQMYLGETRTVQVIASSDIGWFGAQAFLHPDAEVYPNKGIGLAGDWITMAHAAEVIKKVSGRGMLPGPWIMTKMVTWSTYFT